MNIGDRVRMLKTPEEGIVTKILDGNMVEVEIEDGFQIPVLRSELVKVAQEEAVFFGNKKIGKRPRVKTKSQEGTIEKQVLSEIGIYLGFVNINEQKLALYLVNNTDYNLPFVIGSERDGNYKALQSGVLGAKDKHKITEHVLDNFERWGAYVFQFLYFRAESKSFKQPFVKKMRFRIQTFHKSKGEIPILNRKGYVFQLDEQINESQIEIVSQEASTSSEKKPAKIDLETLKSRMFEPNQPEKEVKKETKVQQNFTQETREIDLHIEVLVENHQGMDNAQILDLQLKEFEKQLEWAIVEGIQEVIFIHGVGKGKLRQEIQRKLSGHPDIQYYKDARREKFGYGATAVRLK